MGDNRIHSTCAVIFLLSYNAVMACLHYYGKANRFLLVPCVFSCLSKVRWVAPGMLGDQTALAIVEWSDVFLICGWTVCFCWTTRAGYNVVLQIDTTKEVTKSPALLFVSIRVLTYASLTMYFGTLVVSCILIYAQNRVPAGSLPYISDMWTTVPGNWLSRWAIVQGATYMASVHIIMNRLEGGSIYDNALTALALVSILGLDMVSSNIPPSEICEALFRIIPNLNPSNTPPMRTIMFS